MTEFHSLGDDPDDYDAFDDRWEDSLRDGRRTAIAVALGVILLALILFGLPWLASGNGGAW